MEVDDDFEIEDLEIEEVNPEVHCKVEIKKGLGYLEDHQVVECRIERPYKQESLEELEKEVDLRGINREKGELEINKVNLDNVTIKDLKDLHRKKAEATKQEKIEEQSRIEERQRWIEARKEEFSWKKEKEAKELDGALGGSELLRRFKSKNSDSEIIDEFEDELI